MKLEMEIEKDLGVALWYIFNERGNGNAMQGRAQMVMSVPTEEEWKAGFAYVNSTKKKGERKLEEYMLPYANQIYAGTLVSICLDAYWYDNGLPTIELGHKLAASLLMTKVPKDVLQDIKMPFPAFRINVPSGLLNFTDGEVLHIKVGEHIKPALDNGEPVQGASFAVRAENGGTYSVAENFPDLLQMNYKNNVRMPFDPFELNSAHIIRVKDEDAVRLAMVAQLIAGVSLYMTGSDEEQFPIKKVGKGHSWSPSRRGKTAKKHDVDLYQVMKSFVGETQKFPNGESYTPWNGPHVGFDTVLVNETKGWLEEFGKPWMFTTKEGAHSMYIDCVSKQMSRSSYELDKNLVNIHSPQSIRPETISEFFAKI